MYIAIGLILGYVWAAAVFKLSEIVISKIETLYIKHRAKRNH